MARLVYIDETGAPRGNLTNHRYLQIVAAIVDEEHVRGLGESLQQTAMNHLGWFPAGFEFHGNQLWNGNGEWDGKAPTELLAAYEDVIGLIDQHCISIAHSTIDRQRLHDKYHGGFDGSAYRLGLQFLLEKVNQLSGLKVLVADESKEQEVEAKDMVARLQEWGGGEVPGRQVTSIIDSLHFVQSHESPGVQIADMAAYLLHRVRLTATEHHPDVLASRQRMLNVINSNTETYRMTWP
ncbi:MAG: DUF3800 domain-containing protein [bacterium]|nr:DUF3800 domain-containing protein [bacterium]